MIRRMLASLVFLYLAVCAGMYFLQDRLVFPSTSINHELGAAPNLEVIEIDTGEGALLRGVLRKPLDVTSDRAPVVLYFGGNAEEVTWWSNYAGWPRDWAVVLVNYRGFGRSTGKPSEHVLNADAVRLYDWTRARAELDATRIVAFGRSLGGGVATYLAADRPVRGVILTAPFDSALAVAQSGYPWLPVSMLLRHRFDSFERAPRLKSPLLMLVAPGDRVIPVPHSERLYAAWAGEKEFVLIVGASHTDIASDPQYWAAIARFLA
ncbi:MAG: alpha/beta hydrolase, partial [Burkholderiales bacterium]